MKNISGTGDYFETAVMENSKMLLRLAFSYLRSTQDAEDAVQEAFMSLLKKGDGFESDEHLRAWLVRVTVNRCKDMLGSARRRNTLPMDAEALSIATKGDAGETLALVLSLPPKYRGIMHLYYYEGYSAKEIAGILKMNASTVRTRIERGRAVLKEILKEDDEV